MKREFDRYFLAANSFNGFVSYFGDCYSAENGYKTYIIKGGPGTGKSSFMKYIASRAMDKGFKVQLCHCSSDPDSLDGVIIEDKKTVLLDGTSPHIVEPKYPGVCENIIDLGRFWDSEALRKNSIDIINTTNINKEFHKTASVYLTLCGEVAKSSLSAAKAFIKQDKIIAFAEAQAKKLIPESDENGGSEAVRFISGITPNGIMSFPNTVTDNAENLVIFDDKIGAFSGIFMSYIRDYALKNGYDIITLKSPFLPDILIDHIMIPKLSLAFVTENEFTRFESAQRRIHCRRFTDLKAKRREKTKLSANEKLKTKFLFSATEMLSKAKLSHDTLERFYTDSMDFEKMGKYTKEFCEELLK